MLILLVACGAERPAYEGAWRLESSHVGEERIAAPEWEGVLIVADGRFARSYTRAGAPDADDPPWGFHSNAGIWEADGSRVQLRLEQSNYPELAEAVFDNHWSVDGDRLTLTGEPAFAETWVRP